MTTDHDGRDSTRSADTVPLGGTDSGRPSDDSGRHGRFIPGTLFGARYRIIGLLGRGGMGEVYAADDLELGQAVALKLLPRRLTKDESALAALRNEVRVARQIAHPNVCHVYDIGAIDDQHFVSMEYVDGEDLAGLLRRIGRLPGEKAADLARQLAAGLGAAHAMGVLHRDLKPANIMIDGRGRVHIMDFGLAGDAEELRTSRQLAGTVGYMAPELLSGEGPTTRSDVYALGLVMYEVLTGRRAYEGGSIRDLRERQESAPPANPVDLVGECDPAVARVVMRCLERDPQLRPQTAQVVAMELPGGDPLTAALAAGETPSPEMVAAAGGRGWLPTSIGVALLGATILGCVAMGLLNDRVALFRLTHLDKSPAVLADRARETLAQLGFPQRPEDVAYGLGTSNLISHIATNDTSMSRWQDLDQRRPTPYEFWYREWGAPMMPADRIAGQVGWRDPPFTSEGMLRVLLDQSGRLRRFDKVGPLRQVRADSLRPADWSRFFSLADLDAATFREVEPIYAPPLAADTRRAWEGSYPGPAGLPVRIEAGEWNGQAVYFNVMDTGARWWLLASPAAPGASPGRSGGMFSFVRWGLQVVFIPLCLFLPAVVAWRNLRLRRADARSAFRIGGLCFILTLLTELLARSHAASILAEILSVVGPAVLESVFWGTLVGLGYLAAEPYLRRQWPTLLISWTRLTSGRVRDPLVGRDVLIGAAAGALSVAVYDASLLLPTWFGHPMGSPRDPDLDALAGGRLALASFLDPWFLQLMMAGALVLTVCLLLFRSKLLALVVVCVVMLINTTDADLGRLTEMGQLSILVADAMTVLVILLLLRVGFLAVVALEFFYYRLLSFPVTLDTSVWYSSTSMLLLLALAAIAFEAFRVATAGRSGSPLRA